MPVIPEPKTYEALKPANASVFDPAWKAPLRAIVSLLGLDDPTQIMNIGMAMPVGKMSGGAQEAAMAVIKRKLPRLAKVLKMDDGLKGGVWGKELDPDKRQYRVPVFETDQIIPSKMESLRSAAKSAPGGIWPFSPVSVVREGGIYKLQDGHHRVALAKELGVKYIPAVLKSEPDFASSKPVQTVVSILRSGQSAVTIPDLTELPVYPGDRILRRGKP